jgi:hypothetical protein
MVAIGHVTTKLDDAIQGNSGGEGQRGIKEMHMIQKET